MYKCHVKKEPQTIITTHEKNLGDSSELTIAKLREYGIEEHDRFYVHSYDDYSIIHGNEYILSWEKVRFETEEEVAIRVAKEEDYNRRYDEYHKNKVIKK